MIIKAMFVCYIDGNYIVTCTYYIYEIHFVNISAFRNGFDSHSESYSLVVYVIGMNGT